MPPRKSSPNSVPQPGQSRGVLPSGAGCGRDSDAENLPAADFKEQLHFGAARIPEVGDGEGRAAPRLLTDQLAGHESLQRATQVHGARRGLEQILVESRQFRGEARVGDDHFGLAHGALRPAAGPARGSLKRLKTVA